MRRRIAPNAVGQPPLNWCTRPGAYVVGLKNRRSLRSPGCFFRRKRYLLGTYFDGDDVAVD